MLQTAREQIVLEKINYIPHEIPFWLDQINLLWPHNSSRQRIRLRDSGNQQSKARFLRMGFRHVLNMLLPPHQQLGMSATLS